MSHSYSAIDCNFFLSLFTAIIPVLALILFLIITPVSNNSKEYYLSPNLIKKIDWINSLTPLSAYALSTVPKLNQLNFHIQEFNIPGNNSIPLFALYDKSRNVIWVGDTVIDSGRILEFDLNSSKYTEHKLNGTSIVTVMTLDPKSNQLWYIDPLMKHLGKYDPSSNTTKLYNIPTQGTVSRIAIDLNDDLWLTSPDTDELLRFNSQTKDFTTIHLPTANAMPIGILVDKDSGLIWIAEGAGKLASIDPVNNKIKEHPLIVTNNTSYSPTELFYSPFARNVIYISDHDNHTTSAFNTTSKVFKTYPVFNREALPFGMTMDNKGFLWIAEHTTNKIAVIDPKTGASREIEIPKSNPNIQFLTSDSNGNIWFVEQLGNSIGVITSSPHIKFRQ